MLSPASLKVSYCTTCKGRLHLLKETLPQNLAAEKDNPNVEFVILSYGKDPEMDKYMHLYDAEIASGRIKYVVYPDAEHFQMGHAKNMAHRMATGDIFCSLDADNILATNYSKWLEDKFAQNPHTLVSLNLTKPSEYLFKNIYNKMTKKCFPAGIYGRIAISSETFEATHGYDENYKEWGGDDREFSRRCEEAGSKKVEIPIELWGGVIDHDRVPKPKEAQSAKNWSLKDCHAAQVMRRMKEKSPAETVNASGNVGCGTVYINFSDEPTEIFPLDFAKERAIKKDQKEQKEVRVDYLKTDWAEKQQMNADNGIPPIRYR